MDTKIRLLFVDDEERFLETTTTRLELRGLDVESYTNGTDALEAASKRVFDVALLDLKMPGMDGKELLALLKNAHPDTEVVILTGHGSIDTAVDTMKEGAYEYLQKPCELEDLIKVVSRAFAKRIVTRQSEKATRVEKLMEGAIGLSPMEILEKLRQIDRD